MRCQSLHHCNYQEELSDMMSHYGSCLTGNWHVYNIKHTAKTIPINLPNSVVSHHFTIMGFVTCVVLPHRHLSGGYMHRRYSLNASLKNTFTQKMDQILGKDPKRFIVYEDKNKARNSHKPRLGEYVQKGNIRSITYIIRGGFFHLLFKKIVSKK